MRRPTECGQNWAVFLRFTLAVSLAVAYWIGPAFLGK